MSKFDRLINNLFYNRKLFFDSIINHIGFILPDKFYLSIKYRCLMGKWINWNSPQLYQEKLQWLKIFDRNPLYTKMVDKITVKEYVANIIGKDYIIPTLGVWDKFDDIKFDLLPEQFVLKTNNGGGNTGVVVCTDKKNLDYKKTKLILESAMKNSIYRKFREWPYKNIKPRIFAEVYMTDDSEFNSGGLSDYKFTCFNGEVDNVMVCVDRQLNDPKFYFFNREWQLLPLNVRGKNTESTFKLPKPECMNEMFELASQLSRNIPFLRVDLYCINGKPYFGETTFFPASGFDSNILPETEILFGNKINLSNLK